jgi:hypothetical protein
LKVDDKDSCSEDRDPLDIEKAQNSQNSAYSHHGKWNTFSCAVGHTHAHILKISGLESTSGNEPSSPDVEIPVSLTFKFFTNLQLALIMSPAVCWVYDHR